MKQSTKDYLVNRMYKASQGLANAVLVTLGIGLLIQSIGTFTGWSGFNTIGTSAQLMLAPAIGAGIAYQLGGNTLVIFSAMVCSTIGANAIRIAPDGGVTLLTGQPISAVLAAVIATWVGKRVMGKTKLDMMAIPFAAIFVGGISGVFLAAITTPLLQWLSAEIATSVKGSPLVGAVIISLVWSIFLMSPASSAAIAIALQLDPVSSAAALIGCTAQFAGFTAMSLKQNDIGANIAQSLITPKVQFPNLVKNPRLAIPPFISAMICAPIATMLFNFQVPFKLAGLGLNSLIAPINIMANQGVMVLLIFIAVGVVLPIIISLAIYHGLKVVGWVKKGDLRLVVQ